MNKYCKIKNDMMHNRRKSTCLALEMFYMPLCDDCGGDEFWSCVGSIFRGFRRSVAQALIYPRHTCLIYFHIRRWNKGYSPRYSIAYTITAPPLQLYMELSKELYAYGCVYHMKRVSLIFLTSDPLLFSIVYVNAHIHREI